ncbi:MAG TPA: hypothetical protein VGF23_00675 [Gaiellaceae bacterium]
MATQDPGYEPAPLTSLPRLDQIPRRGEGYDADKVAEAFEAFERHVTQLQARLHVLQVAGGSASEPSGHAVRMDALHLIRAASEFADTIEQDAQRASAAQFARTEAEVSHRQRELNDRETEIERYRQESERQRSEVINAARNEARELEANATREATEEVREAEARAARLLEQARHQATELTNATRAEVEQTLEWARAQAGAILTRAQHGAEQLLTAAGLGEEAIGRVADAIVQSVERTGERPAGILPAGQEPESDAESEEEPQAGPSPPPSPAPPPPVAPHAESQDESDESDRGEDDSRE